MKYLNLIFLIFIFSCSNKKLDLNKKIILRNYDNHYCMNLNENYLCIDTEHKTNIIQNILYNMNPINPKLYNISYYLYSKNLIIESLEKKLELSEKKLKLKDHIYSEDGEDIIEESYKKSYKPIYNKKLSDQFNKLFLENIENMNTLDEKNIYSYLDIKKEEIDKLETIILKFIKANLIIINIRSYDNLSIHLNREIYNYIKKHHYEKIKKMNMSNIIMNISYKRKAKENERNIKEIFDLKKNKVFTKSDMQILDREFSSLFSIYIKESIKKCYDKNHDCEYIIYVIYQFIIDIFSISKNDINKFKSLTDFKETSKQLQLDTKIIFDFYKKHPLKVFITQTNNYHPPHIDGIYGYLYINKKDFKKLEDKRLIKYLLYHEINHIVYHFVSINKSLTHMLFFYKALILNLLKEKTIFIEEINNIIDNFIKLLNLYDNQNRRL